MQQSTAAHPAPLTTRHGVLSIQSSRTVEGGFAINTYAGTTGLAEVASEFPRPRTWADLRDDFEAGMKRDRAELAARKQVA